MPIFDPKKPARKIRYRCRVCGIEELEIWNMPDNPRIQVEPDETITLASCGKCFAVMLKGVKPMKSVNRVFGKVNAPEAE